MPDHPSTTEFALVEQAMGNPPGWLTHWGITVLVLFLSIVLSIMAMIQYPDSIRAEAMTYIDHPPIDLFLSRAGTVHNLLVKDGDTVQSQQPFAVLESPADWQTVLQLDQALQDNTWSQTAFPSKDLGSLNELYQKLRLLHTQIHDAHQTNITSLLNQGTQQEIEQNKTLNASLKEQMKVFQQEIHNIAADLERSKQLRQEGSISQRELEAKENAYLQSKRELHRMESAIIANNIRINQLKREIPIPQKQQHDLLFNLKNNVQQQKELLQTAINRWKKEYILYTSSAGRLVFNNNLQEGGQIQPNTLYGTIVPLIEDKQSYIKAQIEPLGSGKIAIGQKALVYLNNYPSSEYGTLSATVLKVAPVPTEKFYEVILALPTNWVTNYNITIPKQHNMMAQVAIQTKEYTLLERVFAGLVDAVAN